MKRDIKKLEPQANVPFKFNSGFFKIDTIIKQMPFWQSLLLIIISMLFILAVIFMLKQYAFAGLSISAIFNLSSIGISKIIKSRSP